MKKRIMCWTALIIFSSSFCVSCTAVSGGIVGQGRVLGSEDGLKTRGRLDKNSPQSRDIPALQNGITLLLHGDRKLNWHHRNPHALVVCAYQLKDLNGFNMALEEKDGFVRLMGCGRFDASVNFAQRIVIQPGKDVRAAMELVEGSRQLAFIAGYFEFKRDRAVTTFELPMKGVFFPRPAGIDLSLKFGSDEIEEIRKRD